MGIAVQVRSHLILVVQKVAQELEDFPDRTDVQAQLDPRIPAGCHGLPRNGAAETVVDRAVARGLLHVLRPRKKYRRRGDRPRRHVVGPYVDDGLKAAPPVGDRLSAGLYHSSPRRRSRGGFVIAVETKCDLLLVRERIYAVGAALPVVDQLHLALVEGRERLQILAVLRRARPYVPRQQAALPVVVGEERPYVVEELQVALEVRLSVAQQLRIARERLLPVLDDVHGVAR